jgi:hypothetical protein
VRRVALAGNADRARERLVAVMDAGADSVHVFPLGEGRMQTIRAFAACVGDLREERAGVGHETPDIEPEIP